MTIIEYYYNDANRMLYVEFSADSDGDDFYRVLELHFNDVEYYSPELMYEGDMDEIEESLVIDIIKRYLEDNDLPEQLNL